MKKKYSYAQQIKSIAKINGKDILPDVVLPKLKSAKTATKGRVVKNNLLEKKLEKEIIISLRMQGYDVYKTGETSMSNSMYCEVGVADITVKHPYFKIAYIEVKVKGRKQRDTQIEAEKRCKKNGIDYAVVYSLREANVFIKNLITKTA